MNTTFYWGDDPIAGWKRISCSGTGGMSLAGVVPLISAGDGGQQTGGYL